MANKYSPKEIDFIIENHSILEDQDIARHLGRTLKGIQFKRREMKLSKRHTPTKVMKARTLNVEYNALVCFLSTGKLTDIAKSRIKEISNNHRILRVRLPRKRKIQDKYGLCCELYIHGLSYSQIGLRTGMHKANVQKIINRYRPYTGKHQVTITLQSKMNFKTGSL
jgi:hypothetical protein